MFRKLVGCLLIIGMLAASSLTAFAAPVENAESTSQPAVDNNADAKDKLDYKDLLTSVIKHPSSNPTSS
jgi:hypothetical protein